MRVMVIGGFAPSLLNFRGSLLAELVRRGHQVFACAPEDDPSVRLGLSEIGVEFRLIPLKRSGIDPWSDLKTLFSLSRIYRRVQPDFVIAYTAKPVIYSCLARMGTLRPRVFALITGLGYGFGVDNTRQRVVGRIVQRLYRIALRFSSGVIFQNPDDRQLFEDRKLKPTAVPETVVNGSGVDLAWYSPVALPDRPVFLLIARLLAEKGVREYRRAALAVKERFPEVRFDLAGPLDSNPSSISSLELKKWVAEGSINYLGELGDVRPAIEQSSCFVLPSFYREGTPRTILEAMAMRRPIITTDAPGCRETVVNGVNGFLIPPRDHSALAAAIINFVEQSREQTEAMAQASLKLARDKFDVHKVNQKIIEFTGL